MTAGLYHNQKIVVKRFSFYFFWRFGRCQPLTTSADFAWNTYEAGSLDLAAWHPHLPKCGCLPRKTFQRSEPPIETNQFTTTCLLFSEANGILRMPQIGCQYRIYMGCEKEVRRTLSAHLGVYHTVSRRLITRNRSPVMAEPGNTLRANVGSEMRVTRPACLLAGRFSTADTRKPDGILLAKKRTCQSAFPERMIKR